MEGYLHCFVSDKQKQWFKWLPLEEWWYNNSFHTATKIPPFMSLYGYHPSSIISSLKENSRVQVVEFHIEHQQQVLQILKDNLTMAQNRMKEQADQHHSERSFEVWDWVFLILQPYKQMSIKKAKMNNNYHQSTMVLIRCCKRLVLWHTNWSCLHLHEFTQFSMFHAFDVSCFMFHAYSQVI
jgi:hypothetical protein